jgi:hypothetical protein
LYAASLEAALLFACPERTFFVTSSARLSHFAITGSMFHFTYNKSLVKSNGYRLVMTREWHSICTFFSKSINERDEQRMKRTQEAGGIMMNRLKEMKGTSLLEVTVAMIILAIGLLGLAGLHLVAMQSDTLGQQATLASNLAKNKLAELQEVEQLSDGLDHYIDKDNGVTYTRQWMVQADVSQEDMITVQVQVSWQGSIVDRCVTVSTVIKRT